MKKLVVIFLLLVYGITSSGTTISLHYCCGKLDDISFSTVFEKECAMDNKGVSKKRCCDNKHVELKLKADQEPAAKWLQVQKTLSSPVAISAHFITSEPKFILQQPATNGPPESIAAIPLFVKNRMFRI